MRIVISDSSCLIDLRKASALDAFLKLPYEFLIPNTLFEEELVRFTATEKNLLLRGGLKVVDLPGESTTPRGVPSIRLLSSRFIPLTLLGRTMTEQQLVAMLEYRAYTATCAV